MKRYSAILIAQFVVIAAAAFFGSWAYARWQSTPAEPAGNEMSWFQSQLGLNVEQASKLEKVHEAFQAEQSKLCEEHCAKRFELGELIKQSDSMSPRVEQLARELSELEARSQRITIQHIFEVGKQLSASQREKFVSKVYDQICSSCPMGSHRPASGKQAACETEGCGCMSSSDNATPSSPAVAGFPPQHSWPKTLPPKASAARFHLNKFASLEAFYFKCFPVRVAPELAVLHVFLI